MPAVRGSKAEIGLKPRAPDAVPRVTVGTFLAIATGSSCLIGVVTEISSRGICDALSPADAARMAAIDLVGEIRRDQDETEMFVRGVSNYPTIADQVSVLSPERIALVYTSRQKRSITIGTMFHDSSLPALVDADSLLSRHFAVLGSTGVGKSSGVAIILREMLALRPDLRVFLLDCHNEYGESFGDRAYVVNSRNLKLPFWLFNFEELVDIIFGGRAPVEEELEILSELIPIAKSNYLSYRSSADRLTVKRVDPRATGFTVDTPVPYILQDLISLLDERMGKLEKDRKSTRLNSSHSGESRMPSSA